MINLICKKEELNQMKGNLGLMLKSLIGKTIINKNGNSYSVKDVNGNGDIITTIGKVFPFASIDVFKLDDELLKCYIDYKKELNYFENMHINLKYPDDVAVKSNSAGREEFFDMLLSKLNLKEFDGGIKRTGDPHYLHLNLVDDYFKNRNIKKSDLELGVNVSNSNLAVYLIFNDIDKRNNFIDASNENLKKLNVKHIIEEASRNSIKNNDNRHTFGVRVYDCDYELHYGNFEDEAIYVIELLKDTMYLLDNAGIFF